MPANPAASESVQWLLKFLVHKGHSPEHLSLVSRTSEALAQSSGPNFFLGMTPSLSGHLTQRIPKMTKHHASEDKKLSPGVTYL